MKERTIERIKFITCIVDRGVGKYVIELCKQERRPGTPYVLARAADDEEAERLMQAACTELDQEPELMFYLGCIITINIGPEAIGIIYHKK